MRRSTLLPTAALAVGALVLPAAPAAAVDRVPTQRLRDAVTVNGILGHARVLQRTADAEGGTRASGTPGYEASARYVERTLLAAGYDVRLQEFTFPFFQELTPTSLAQTAPEAVDYDTLAFTYSGNGRVEAVAQAVDFTATLPSTSGCETSDFAGFPDGAVAVLQRGTCTFAVKAANAEAAGAVAAVIVNAGVEDPEEVLNGTLGEPGTGIPVVGLSAAAGAQLVAAATAGEVRLAVNVETLLEDRTTWNVLADAPDGDRSRTVVVGAHLDSVLEGPGINDNGSGVATVLEIAEQVAQLGGRNRQHLRFAFWGAEESGLLGSTHYVQSLSDTELQSIYANLNFDMLGSPNFVPFVYDGDLSDTAEESSPAPPGSAQIEDVFTGYLSSRGGSEPTAFSGRSDYGPFIAAGIPAGGLFSGAEGVKTEEQAELYGGQAGQAYDACYHQACDTIANVSTRSLAVLGDAAAHAVLTLARTRTGFYEDLSRAARSTPAQAPQADDAA
ncbi:M20/M25/M40 family metallo-hydrolase [Kineococcus indalonis]|uniref:M20/M25/M40 family metallo-hydrolase n=1 Tax=Kineococcus indalonis TaxID=2696566 RepID=UPI0014120E7F|nr:M20/M25/M40 family metallo-hydrolase [Kineococcus indalonis]NAZ86300.1 M20/M25/M40 family metallo-hydrolase [Kineococcus indalonis]